MFFHRIERLSNADTMKETITDALDGRHYTVIPLVSPYGAAGKYLMDENQSEYLSKYSGSRVNIFYPGEDMKTAFAQFREHIFAEIRDMAGEETSEPGLLVFFPQKKHLVNITVAEEDDWEEFRSMLYLLIDALESGDPLKNINRIKDDLRCLHLKNSDSHSIFEMYDYVIKFYS